MTSGTRFRYLLFAIIFAGQLADADEQTWDDTGIRILSWNISDDAFVSNPEEFHSLLFRAGPQVLLLDEVSPLTTAEQLRNTLPESPFDVELDWHIDFGESGGRQRGVIASLMPLEALPEFSTIVPYPEADRARISRRMSAADRRYSAYSMDEGIPVNGAIILHGGRRLLAVVADLQCCGDDPDSWQESRRRVEAKVIRGLIQEILERTTVDGIVLAGDFNAVNGSVPLLLLSGPYNRPHAGLIPAEVYHLDGSTTWTWDGRKTPFPSNVLDYQLYSPQTLRVRSGWILDSEDLSSEELKNLGLDSNTSNRLSRHRPLVVYYGWE